MTWVCRTQFNYATAAPVVTTDPQFANVTLLVHGNGSNGGTVFTDSSSYNLTATRVGLTTTDTGTLKYGTASLKFVTASSCGITFPNTGILTPIFADVTTHVRNSTLELWFKTTSTTANQTIIAANNGAFNSGAWTILMSNAYAGSVEFWFRDFSPGAPLLKTTSTNYADGNWHFLVVTKSVAAGYTLWIDGVSIANNNLAGGFSSPTAPLAIGHDTTFGRYFDGWIDDIRLTTSNSDSGACRYTTAFTPPTAQFPDS